MHMQIPQAELYFSIRLFSDFQLRFVLAILHMHAVAITLFH